MQVLPIQGVAQTAPAVPAAPVVERGLPPPQPAKRVTANASGGKGDLTPQRNRRADKASRGQQLDLVV